MKKEVAVHYDLVRKINMVSIINYFQQHETATKSEVARHTGLSLPTVSSILGLLLEMGEVTRHDYDTSSGGRPAERFAINLLNSLSLAVILQLDSIEYAVADSIGTILFQCSHDVKDDFSISYLDDLIGQAIHEYPAIKVISVGVPGSINNGVLHFMPVKYQTFNNMNLQEHIHALYHLPTIVENDLNAIVQGQYLRNYEGILGGVVHFTVTEDGVGLGINSNGQVIHGDTGFAGEIGFIPCINNKNVRQAIDEAQSKEELSDILTHVLVIISCLLNPRYFFLSGKKMSEDLIPSIKKKAYALWEEVAIPEIMFVDDIMSLYFIGLIDMARKKYYSPDYILPTEE